MEGGNDGAVRERELPCSKGLYSNIVPQLGAHLLYAASCQVVNGDQAPVTVSARDFDSVYRRGLSVGLSRCSDDVGDHTGHGCRCNHQARVSLHKVLRTAVESPDFKLSGRAQTPTLAVVVLGTSGRGHRVPPIRKNRLDGGRSGVRGTRAPRGPSV